MITNMNVLGAARKIIEPKDANGLVLQHPTSMKLGGEEIKELFFNVFKDYS